MIRPNLIRNQPACFPPALAPVLALALVACAAAAPVLAQDGTQDGTQDGKAITLPSGQGVALQDVMTKEVADGHEYRFRFIAPQIAPVASAPDFDALMTDMQFLCQSYAIPYLAKTNADAPRHVVISLAAGPTQFGDPSPGVRQVFESYTLDADNCVWEMF